MFGVNITNCIYTAVCLVLITIQESFKLVFCCQFLKSLKAAKISGQVALITGGANGLGKAIAVELAKKGCKIAIADVDIDKAHEVTESLKTDYKIHARPFKVDVANHEEIVSLKNDIENELGPVDILINNAGIIPIQSTFEDSSPDEVKTLININLNSHFWTIKEFLHGMKERKRGHIVAISSLSGLIAVPVATGYSATKYAIRGLMESLKTELMMNDEDKYIKTLTVFPYFINTNKDLVATLYKLNVLNHITMLSPKKVAKQIVDGIVYNKRTLIIPSWSIFVVFLLKVLPDSIFKRIGKHFFDIQLPKNSVKRTQPSSQ